jgi:hypothetical protein
MSCRGDRVLTTSFRAAISLPSARRIPVAFPFSMIALSTSVLVKNLHPIWTRS